MALKGYEEVEEFTTLPKSYSGPMSRDATPYEAPKSPVDFLAETRSLLQPQPLPPPPASIPEAVAQGGYQGITLGLGDEAAAGLEAILPFSNEVVGSTALPIGERYAKAKKFYLQRDAKTKEDQPVAYGAAEVVGTVAPAVLASPARAATLAKRTWDAAKVGAKLGTVIGAGKTEGDALDVATGAVEGGVTGAAAGAALQPLGEGLVKGGQWLLDKTKGRVGKLVYRRITGNPEGTVLPEQVELGLDAYQADKAYPRGLNPQSPKNIEEAKAKLAASAKEVRKVSRDMKIDVELSDDILGSLAQELDEANNVASLASTPEEVLAAKTKLDKLEREFEDARDALLGDKYHSSKEGVALYAQIAEKIAKIRRVLSKNEGKGIGTQIGQDFKRSFERSPITTLSNSLVTLQRGIESGFSGLNVFASPTVANVAGRSLANTSTVAGKALQSPPVQTEAGQKLRAYLQKKIDEENSQQSLIGK